MGKLDAIYSGAIITKVYISRFDVINTPAHVQENLISAVLKSVENYNSISEEDKRLEHAVNILGEID
jgi:hypothetical protein